MDTFMVFKLTKADWALSLVVFKIKILKRSMLHSGHAVICSAFFELLLSFPLLNLDLLLWGSEEGVGSGEDHEGHESSYEDQHQKHRSSVVSTSCCRNCWYLDFVGGKLRELLGSDLYVCGILKSESSRPSTDWFRVNVPVAIQGLHFNVDVFVISIFAGDVDEDFRVRVLFTTNSLGFR